MSQISNIAPSSHFITKNGKLYAIFFSTIFSTMHKIETRACIKNLRNGSLPYDSANKYRKLKVAMFDIN